MVKLTPYKGNIVTLFDDIENDDFAISPDHLIITDDLYYERGGELYTVELRESYDTTESHDIWGNGYIDLMLRNDSSHYIGVRKIWQCDGEYAGVGGYDYEKEESYVIAPHSEWQDVKIYGNYRGPGADRRITLIIYHHGYTDSYRFENPAYS